MTAQTVEMQGVIERVERLEKENRWLKRAVALCLIFAGAFAVMGASGKKGKIIQANEFVLRDAQGNARAALKMGSAGPSLALYGTDENQVRALFTVLRSGPAIGFYDPDGKTRVSLGITAKGATLTFNDNNERLRAEMGMFDEGPNLMFLDPEGKPVYKAH